MSSIGVIIPSGVTNQTSLGRAEPEQIIDLRDVKPIGLESARPDDSTGCQLAGRPWRSLPTSQQQRLEFAGTSRLSLLTVAGSVGSISIRCGRARIHLGPGDVCALAPDRSWSLDVITPCNTLQVDFDRRQVADVCPAVALLDVARLDNYATLLNPYIAFLVRGSEDLPLHRSDQVHANALGVVAMALECTLARTADVTRARFDVHCRARRFIIDNLENTDLTSGAVAVGVNVSLRVLQLAFQEQNQTVREVIAEERLTRASEELCDVSMQRVPIGTIARRCGFKSNSHFSDRFSQTYGMSPSNYRRDHLAAAIPDRMARHGVHSSV